MDASTWHRIDRLLDAALDRPEGEREAFVAAASDGDDALVREVMTLLRAAQGPTGGFAELVPGLAAEALHEGTAPVAGPYRVLRRLGQGGMGQVYLALRNVGGAEQRVALKVVRPELVSLADPTALARFRQERAVLATLEHPHIARLLDAGETDGGVPYLAMEYVDGEPITTYCTRRHLPLADRLALIAQVARAVDYAHRRLVVHRDLKPLNVLVAEDGEGRSVPKLLDFGIAKLLDADAASELTHTHARPLTPGYAAPEQLLGERITTATDVYALGVLLYEVVTGARPFAGATGFELERAVLQGDPAWPSTRLRRAEATADGPPADPGIRPAALQGDVDTICLVAMRREPERRYASAAAFADDIERHLVRLPIAARPATLRYRAASFVRRHRAAVTAAAAVLLALIVGLGVALWQARTAQEARDRAETEARRAEQATDFLAGLLQLGDPFEADPIPGSALVDSGAARLRRATDLEPILRADLLGTIGQVYKAQGRFDEHERAAADALALLQPFPREGLRRAEATSAYALALADLGRMAEAAPLAREAFETVFRRRHDPAAAEAYGHTAYRLAMTLNGVNDHTGAVQAVDRALADPPRDGRDRLAAALLTERAFALSMLGRHDEAVATGRSALEAAGRGMEPGSQSEQSVRHNFALVLKEAGRYEEAERVFRGLIADDERQLPPGHPDLVNTLTELAEITLRQGRAAEALAFADRAAPYEGYGESVTDAPLLGAFALYRLGRPDEAADALRLVGEMEGYTGDRARFALGLVAGASGRGSEDATPDDLTDEARRDVRELLGLSASAREPQRNG